MGTSAPRRQPVLAVVVPCFNEERVAAESARQILDVLSRLKDESLIARGFILFVDDGSTDRTWEEIRGVAGASSRVGGLKLARNVGHQKALLAGLLAVREHSDCCISVDADLQDDVSVFREFVLKYRDGFEVVYGVRSDRSVDSVFKRRTALAFYRLMRLMGVGVVDNHADYRLMSREALGHLAEFPEFNLFLRGIIPLIGLPSASVYYERKERFAGESKYPLRKMVGFAFDGITSFSVSPIRFVTLTGLSFCLIALAAAVYGFVAKLTGAAVPGWTSLLLSIWFIGGVQLVSLGLLGEYVGRIYQEAKRRPRYIVEEELSPADLRPLEETRETTGLDRLEPPSGSLTGTS